MNEINEKGVLKEVAERYIGTQLRKEKDRLLLEHKRMQMSDSLKELVSIRVLLDLMQREQIDIIRHLETLVKGPDGEVHYIRLIEFPKTFGEVFIDFVRGQKSSKTRVPDNTVFTFPYRKVFMIKITNDGPANISFQTNRHAMMIDLYSGESDTVSENESFQLTEIRIANTSAVDKANVRLVLYA